jgi:hypothetical protein
VQRGFRQPAAVRETLPDRLSQRVIAAAIGLGFFGPFTMMARDKGQFVPSGDWVLWSTVAYVVTLLVLGGAVVAVHWRLIEGRRDRISKERLLFGRVVTGIVLCILPIWTIGLVHGVYRSVLTAAPLQRATMMVEFDHIAVHGLRGNETHTAVFRLPGARRMFSLEAAPITEAYRPAKGELIPAYGFQNWLGFTVDGVAMRERASPPEGNPMLK